MTESETRRIFEKLDAIGTDVAVVKSQMPGVQQRAEDHEQRIRSLEARLWAAVGVVTLLTFAIPIALNLFIP